jgi:hypothetical protein
MANIDTLKGINNFSDMDLNQLLSGSYIMYLDWGFLDKGAFTNIKLSDDNLFGANRSTLRLSADHNYSIGQVWETFHNNLVWESGISSTTKPINISGVYVNSTFYPLSTTGTFKHHIEYNTGRVVFDTAIPTNSNVNLEYSYKLISVVEAKDYPIIREIQFCAFDPINNNFLQVNSGEYNKNPNTRVQLPIIGVEVTPKIKLSAYELGNYVQRINTDIIFHVLAETDSMAKKIISILALQKESTTFILDMDAIARSGAFPLSYNGSLNTNPKTYPALVAQDAFKYGKAFIADAVGINEKWISNNLYHGSVRCVIETIY